MVTKPITLKVWHKNTVALILNQGEVNSRYIRVTFEDINGNLDLTGRQVTFYAQKPDGTIIFNNCDIDVEQNTASVVITSQMVSSAGLLNCEFQIFDSENSLLKVNGLSIIVEPNKDFSEAIESTSEFNALIEAINKAQTNNDELENYLGKASILSANIGTLSNLTTEEKSSLVGAVNEVNTSLNQVSNTVDGINTDLDELNTAINEVNTSLNQVSNTVDGINTDLDELNTAINAVNTKVIPLSQGGTGATTLTTARENLGIIAATILYSNDSGTQGTITLSDSAANYNYLEIYYSSNDGDITMCKVNNPNGKIASLSATLIYNNIYYKKAAWLQIQAKTITWLNTGFATIANGSTPAVTSGNSISVLRVVGYK